MLRKTNTTWDPRVDNDPKNNGTRVKFSKEFQYKIVLYMVDGSTLIAANIFYFYKHFLHKKGARILKFFESRSAKEFQAEKNGFANIFIQAKRIA
jgi:hypothetical protein